MAVVARAALTIRVTAFGVQSARGCREAQDVDRGAEDRNEADQFLTFQTDAAGVTGRQPLALTCSTFGQSSAPEPPTR